MKKEVLDKFKKVALTNAFNQFDSMKKDIEEMIETANEKNDQKMYEQAYDMLFELSEVYAKFINVIVTI